jgi:hypothetical protein
MYESFEAQCACAMPMPTTTTPLPNGPIPMLLDFALYNGDNAECDKTRPFVNLILQAASSSSIYSQPTIPLTHNPIALSLSRLSQQHQPGNESFLSVLQLQKYA